MKQIGILLLVLFSYSAFAQTELQTIKKANELIADKKYETAFTLLDKFDPDNNKPDIVLLKQEILLGYFVTSLMHQAFSLKDIDKSEDILDYRGKDGVSDVHMFQADSILEGLITRHPANCKLYKALGDYYYEVHLKYGGRWLKEDSELFPLMETNFKKAVDGNCAEFMTYYSLGYINLVQEKTAESIPWFLKSIALNKEHASSHYNLAYAYLFTDDRANALTHAKNALELYQGAEYKSDAAQMVAQIYTELGENSNALTYHEKAFEIDPGNYNNNRSLLGLYVKQNHKKAGEMTRQFFDRAPDNPTIYNDLEAIYLDNKKDKDLIAFYNSQLPLYKQNEKVLGGLNFYLAQLYIRSDKKVAKEHFIKSRSHFEKVFENDHEVFAVIAQGLEQCEK